MKKMNALLKKCKSLSKQLGRSSSYSSLRSESCRERDWSGPADGDVEAAVVFVGSSRRRYTIRSKHLSHPLINALIDRSKSSSDGGGEGKISVKCEVVLFDHLLWMLENADPDEVVADGALEELTQLYVC